MAFDRVWGDKIHKTVILDTSALLMFFEFSFDWETELYRLLGAYRLVIPAAVIHELEILVMHRRGQKKAAAALKFIEKYDRIDDDEGGSADEALIQLAGKTKGIVVTNDTRLRQRLRKLGYPVVFLRGKKKLSLDE